MSEARIASKAHDLGRMDSYALARITDQHVSEAIKAAGHLQNPMKNHEKALFRASERLVWSFCEAFDRKIAETFNGSFQLRAPKSLQRWRRRLAQVMDSHLSNGLWTFLILTNSIYLGVHLEITARDAALAQRPIFFQIHLGYAVLFTLEVLLRALAARSLWQYVAGRNWAWNCLDIFVVVSSWVEMAVDFATGEAKTANTNLRIVRILRMGRLARVVRVVRVVRLFRALRTLVASLMGTYSCALLGSSLSAQVR